MSDTPTSVKRCLCGPCPTPSRRTFIGFTSSPTRSSHVTTSLNFPSRNCARWRTAPFDFFLAPILFEEDYRRDPSIIYNEGVRREIRGHALEIARRHGFDVNPPDFITGVEESLRGARDAGLSNMVLTTSGRRYKHRVMEEHGISEYFDEIIDRDETYFRKEQGIYHLFRKLNRKLDVILLSGTASYLRAGNNLEFATVAGNDLSVFTVALATEYSYNDEGDAGRGQAEAPDTEPRRTVPEAARGGRPAFGSGYRSPGVLFGGVASRAESASVLSRK